MDTRIGTDITKVIRLVGTEVGLEIIGKIKDLYVKEEKGIQHIRQEGKKQE